VIKHGACVISELTAKVMVEVERAMPDIVAPLGGCGGCGGGGGDGGSREQQQESREGSSKL
jgi:hypothetical protein